MSGADEIRQRVTLETNLRQSEVVSRLFQILQREHEKSCNGTTLQCSCTYCRATYNYAKIRILQHRVKKQFERYMLNYDYDWFQPTMEVEDAQFYYEEKLRRLEEEAVELQTIKNEKKNCFL